MGDIRDRAHENRTSGQVPGVAYPGGLEKSGPRGKAASKFAEKWAKPLDGIDRDCLPEWMKCEDVWELWVRILHWGFRNHQTPTRQPAHVAPPFQTMYGGRIFSTGTQSITQNATYTDIVTGKTANDMRGVIAALGVEMESEAAYRDVSIRVLVNGTAHPGYADIRLHVFEMRPPTPLLVPIPLGPGSTSWAVQANGLSALTHTVDVQVLGYVYPVAGEYGTVVKSTIVDTD